MEEYKIGDWVITKGYVDYYDGIPLQINKIERNQYYYFNKIDNKKWREGQNFGKSMILRKAENHEIPLEHRKEVNILENFILF